MSIRLKVLLMRTLNLTRIQQVSLERKKSGRFSKNKNVSQTEYLKSKPFFVTILILRFLILMLLVFAETIAYKPVVASNKLNRNFQQCKKKATGSDFAKINFREVSSLFLKP